jgi:hypothetical protein
MTSFKEKLNAEALDYFNEVAARPYSQQAVAFFNAYWPEVHEQAEFCFSVAWKKIMEVDMESKGISLVHKYEEGNDLDFDMGLRFYEVLCKFLDKDEVTKDNEEWLTDLYEASHPGEIITSIKRKQELKEKVDVNFDGRVSMLEYLLYQYKDFANPADFVTRSLQQGDEHPEITKARLALEEVNKRIRAYEAEKARLEAIANSGSGVKALGARNMLAQIDSSPLKEELNKALITAEAAVRIATKKYGGGSSSGASGSYEQPQAASIWWMNRDLLEKQRKYGRVKK